MKSKRKKSILDKKKKIKVLTISDHPLLPSGVGTQTKYFIEALLDTGDFEVISIGAAIQHEDYNPVKTDKYGDDWVIFPRDNYGDPNLIRAMMTNHKPDILWFMTDPRFYPWLWQMEDEIRCNCPMVYYHVWDNYPVPDFNKNYYDSTDVIVSISKLTHDIVNQVSDDTVDKFYIPHAVDENIFKKLTDEKRDEFYQEQTKDLKDKFVVFWNNRNARRKQTGSLMFWFKSFLDEVGEDKALLFMHTDPKDPNGQDVIALAEKLGLNQENLLVSMEKINPDQLALLYNVADVTINISDAEGFGLGTLESLYCGTPIIANTTGGLQDQVVDDDGFEYGVALKPASKAVIGSQEVPYIYEDRLDEKQVVEGLLKMYNLSQEEREVLSEKCQQWAREQFSFNKFNKDWVKVMKKTHKKFGSWPNKKYKKWEAVIL